MASDEEQGEDLRSEQERDAPLWVNIKDQILAPSEEDLLPTLQELEGTDVQIIPRQEGPEDEPAHLRLERDIPRPLGGPVPTQYVDPPTRGGSNPQDVTDFVPEQAYVSENNLPRLFRLMAIPREHPELQEVGKVGEIKRKGLHKNPKYLRDENGIVMATRVKRKQGGKKVAEKVRVVDHPILPRNISSKVEPWRIAMWLLYDGNLKMWDIADRIKYDKPEGTTKLSERVRKWRRSRHAGQFSVKERKKANNSEEGQDRETDRMIAEQHFPKRPDDLEDSGILDHLNAQARAGGLNKIYWNTPWQIFLHKDKKDELKVLVQQENPKYKNLYFEADDFDSGAQRRERPLKALWDAYMFVTHRPSINQDKYEKRNFDSIAGIVQRLDAEHRLTSSAYHELPEISNASRLDFSGKFEIIHACRSLSSFVRYLDMYAALMGLDKTWSVDDLFEDSTHAQVKDLDTSPKMVAGIVVRTIENLHDELIQTMKSMDPVSTANLKLELLSKKNSPSGTNPLKQQPLDRVAVLRSIGNHFVEEYSVIQDMEKAYKKGGKVEGKKAKLENLSMAMKQLSGRILSSLRIQAKFLGLSSVYYLKPFADPNADQETKTNIHLDALNSVWRILGQEIQKHPELATAFFSRPDKPHNQLQEKALKDCQVKKRKMEERSGEGPRKKRKNTPVSNLSAVVGDSPTSPYTNFPRDDWLNAAFLITELDVVLQAHGKAPIPATETTFTDRLLYTINTRGYEDVMGHYRISVPVVRIIEGAAFTDHANARDLIARAVDTALIAAMYSGESLQPNDPDDDNDSFYTNVAKALRDAMPAWADYVRFVIQVEKDYVAAHPPDPDGSTGGNGSPPPSPNPTVSPLQREIGESPRNPYARLSAVDQLNPIRLNQELYRVLQKHGKTVIFAPGDTFIRRIQQVVTSGYEDVMGHYRIASPIIRLLRDSGTQDSDKQTLATAVWNALLSAGYGYAHLWAITADINQWISGVADNLEAVLHMWVAQVRFEIQNETNYRVAFPNGDQAGAAGG